MFHIGLDLSRYYVLKRQTIRIMSQGTQRAVREGVEAGAAYARHTHKHKRQTGFLTDKNQLYGQIVSTSLDGAVGVILNKAAYAHYIEYGTKAHWIRPKEGHGFVGPLKAGQSRRAVTDIGTFRKALRFRIGGRTVFAAAVYHPGTKPLPFMAPAGTYAGEQMIWETERVTFVLAAALWD